MNSWAADYSPFGVTLSNLGVMDNATNKTYTIDEWNKQFEKLDPTDCDVGTGN